MRFVPEKVTSSIQVYDSVGGSHTLEARFFRTGTRSVSTGGEVQRYNSWDMVVSIPPGDGTLDDDLITGVEFDNKGRFMGNGSLGTSVHGTNLSDVNTYLGTPADDSLSVNWAATGTSRLRADLGDASSTNGLTGFGSPSTASAIEQDGYASGTLDTMSVSQNGDIVGLYTNGKSKGLYRIEIDIFRNPAGLSSAGQNLFQQSSNSGDPLARTAGEGGAGIITSGALEGSNVDIASEFTRLITAQRGFQVNARVIQTTDAVLQELSGLVR
jgi:flagellar hook protein FlgE